MTNTSQNQLADLLIQQSISGLSNEEQQQLVQLQREKNLSDSELQNEIESLEIVAAAADLASFQSESAVMPNHVKDCVLLEAGKFFESQTSPSEITEKDDRSSLRKRKNSPNTGFNSWMIVAIVSTAACILLLLNSMNTVTVTSPAPRVAMETFLASSPSDLLDVKLLAGPHFTGEGIIDSRLVWSDSLQEGYMDFTGLSVNDPKKSQYQLWIFDSADQAYPVDGGVFDIAADRSIISIDPKIVAQGKFFAVTVEKPGGVVVSDRKRIASVGENLAAASAAQE